MLRLHLFALACAMLVISGCGKSDGPELASVKGKVLLDGQPVSGATVAFIPDNSKGTTGPQSTGETNAQGEFTLRGAGGREGAVVGHHKVTVACPFDPGMGSSPTGDTSAPGETSPCKVPSRYADVKTTDLSVEVKPEANENVVLELKSG